MLCGCVQEESKQRQREDEERRKEVSAKFQSTINDITLKMQEHHQRNQALRQENLESVLCLESLERKGLACAREPRVTGGEGGLGTRKIQCL